MNERMHPPLSDCDGMFLIRRPVRDRKHNVWGYELAAGGGLGTEEDAGDCVLGEGMEVGLAGVTESSGIIAPFTREMMLEQKFFGLPPGRSFLQLGSDAGEDADLLDAVREAKKSGYGLVLDRFEPEKGREALAVRADMLKISISGRTPREIITIASRLKNHPARLVATGVQDWQTFEGVRALGFSFYQGAYFGRPRVEPGTKLSGHSLMLLRTLGELLQPGRDLQEFAPLIASDPMLSYRLLRFINSAAFCLVQRVSSVEQAVNLLGMSALRQWAMFMVVADLDGTGKGEELAYLALQRGRFLEQCAGDVAARPLPSQAMFLVGLFSLLDALLGLPMREALRDLPLDQAILDGLSGKPGWVRRWLDLVEAVERGDWRQAGELCEKIGLLPRIAAVKYLKASAWAGERFSCSRAEQD
ncbi:MAG: EAL and HDOD domain-containing protein [Desulfovibrio sp.]